MANEWANMAFADAVQVNPSVPLRKGQEYPFVEMQAVEPSWRDVSESERRVFTSGGARFMSGDTLMARITPCLENGKIARYRPRCGGNEPAFGSTEFIVIRGRDGVTDNDYAYYLTKWQEFRQFAISQMTGSSGRQRVPASALENFLVPVPPISEQRAIAQVLGTLDDKIECNRQMNRSLEGIVRALFKSWFIDFDPVIDNALAAGKPIPDELADRAALRQQVAEESAKPLPDELRALFPDEFICTDSMEPAGAGTAGRWIPKGWEVAPLSSIATNPRRTVRPTDVTPETPYIGLEHMPRQSISLDAWGQAADVASGKSSFHQGEILFGKLRPYFHKVGLAPVGGVCSTDILVLASKQDCWRTFVLALVSSKAFVDYTDQCSAGTKMPRTNWTDMGRYGIAMPPTSLAEIFQQHTAQTLRRITFAVRQNSRLSTLRDTLLPQLLSGELRVPDISKGILNGL